jgi:glycosyltransferase involved in cell wall biosynthesis
MPEVVDASSGLVVPRGDVGAMHHAVETVLGFAPERRGELAGAARARVVLRFGTRKMMSELERLYEEVTR